MITEGKAKAKAKAKASYFIYKRKIMRKISVLTRPDRPELNDLLPNSRISRSAHGVGTCYCAFGPWPNGLGVLAWTMIYLRPITYSSRSISIIESRGVLQVFTWIVLGVVFNDLPQIYSIFSLVSCKIVGQNILNYDQIS